MLDQLERLQSPTGGWEVIAVDNGSSDDSLKIMTERAKRLRMTVLSEPRRGKNVALNTALPLANGDIIAFTDDDIILSPDWLVCIERIAAQQPDYDIFGGPIYPVWENPRQIGSCETLLKAFWAGPIFRRDRSRTDMSKHLLALATGYGVAGCPLPRSRPPGGSGCKPIALYIEVLVAGYFGKRSRVTTRDTTMPRPSSFPLLLIPRLLASARST
jgi:hypothetical protein